ncbi:MAG: DNA polymerase IV [Gammaproteobacteria bacterium]|jgi:DNA polymerase IV|nr:DNA polymerase IV [Gammaproteobacteria bacterium]MBT7371734.1 DNA polymerase IV [Gammaproteobacteria bacterium]
MEERWPKIIAHADMDAFYAAVEQLDDPSLRGKPILIGPQSYRGVVLTASYEARPFNVGSAMPMGEARRRCPHALVVSPRFARYQEISEQIMDVFSYFSPYVEALSLDEAFLDMSGAEHFFGAPEEMGRRIKAAVKDVTHLNISVGVSGTKYVAKVASAHDKPNGLTVVPQHKAVNWLATQPVNRLWGVGPKTTPKLNQLGFHTIGQIAKAERRSLVHQLGARGGHLHDLANARDPRRVSRGRSAKSIGSDRTLSQDVSDRRDIELYLRRSAERIARRVRDKNYVAGGIRIRLKTTKFEMLTRQRQFKRPVDTAAAFLATATQLLNEVRHPGPFRLVGMAAFNLNWRSDPLQLDIFEDSCPRKLETTLDSLKERYGKDVVFRGSDMGNPGTVSSNGVNLDFLDYRDGERVSTPESS